MTTYREIRCVACDCKVQARLTDGAEIYSHRPDLHSLPFWKCNGCGNFVGCHHKMKTNPTQPLGIIATPELQKARRHIHALMDPLWEKGLIKRGVTEALGWKYHTACIRSVEEAREVYRLVLQIKQDLA